MGNSASGYGQSYSPMGYQGGYRPAQSFPTSGMHPMQPQQYGTRPMPMGGQAVGTPGSVFGKGSGAPMFMDANAAPVAPQPSFDVQPGGFDQPQDMSQDVQSVGSPASAFGFGAPPQAPQPTQARADPFANSALYNNPYGFSQQQLGPSINPMGSPQGGYFNGNQYVPHTGNSRNGLDRMARAGMNWNGMPFGKVGA